MNRFILRWFPFHLGDEARVTEYFADLQALVDRALAITYEYGDQAWLEVHEVTPIDVPRFNEAADYHVNRAIRDRLPASCLHIDNDEGDEA